MAKASKKTSQSIKPKKPRGFPKSKCNKECPTGYGISQFTISKDTPKERIRNYCKKLVSKEKPKQQKEPEKPRSTKKEEPSKEKKIEWKGKTYSQLTKEEQEELPEQILEETLSEIAEKKIAKATPLPFTPEEKKALKKVKAESESFFTPEEKEALRKLKEKREKAIEPEQTTELPKIKEKKPKKEKFEKEIEKLQTTKETELTLPELEKLKEKESGKIEMKGSIVDELESKPFDYEKGKDQKGCNKIEARKIAEQVFPLGISEKNTNENVMCMIIDNSFIEGTMNKKDFEEKGFKKSISKRKGIYKDCDIAGINPYDKTYWLTSQDKSVNVIVDKKMFDLGKENFKDCKCKNNHPVIFESKRNVLTITPRIQDEEYDTKIKEFVQKPTYEDFKEENMSLNQYDSLMKKSRAELEKMSKPIKNPFGKEIKADTKEKLISRYWDEQLEKVRMKRRSEEDIGELMEKAITIKKSEPISQQGEFGNGKKQSKKR